MGILRKNLFWIITLIVFGLIVIFLRNNLPAEVLVQIFILYVLIKYTIETQLLREGAQKKEISELRGYFGYKNHLEIDSNGRINQIFKNYGKTPLKLFNLSLVKFVEHGGSIEFNPASAEFDKTMLNPSQEINVICPIPADVLSKGKDNFYVLFEGEYETYDGKTYAYKFTVRLENYYIMNEVESLK